MKKWQKGLPEYFCFDVINQRDDKHLLGTHCTEKCLQGDMKRPELRSCVWDKCQWDRLRRQKEIYELIKPQCKKAMIKFA